MSGKRLAKPEHKEGRGGKKPFRIVLAVVCVFALLLFAAYRMLFVRPELSTAGQGGGAGGGGFFSALTGRGGSAAEEVDYGDGVKPVAEGERKSKDYYTVLIMGRDTGGGGNTDTMLLASYDVTNQKATVMSIPRDTMVNVPWDIKKINSVYNYYGGGDKGIQAVYKEISQLVGFQPDFSVVVEWEAIGELVDAMGGVYYDVPRDMYYDDPYQDLDIHVWAGYRKLTGEDAMGVLRWRHDNMGNGYPDGDLGRIKTQQAFLTAVLEQLLQVQNVAKIHEFAKVFEKNVETDLTMNNIFWFGKQAVTGGLKSEDVQFLTMPNRTAYCYSRTVKNNQSYVLPNAQELLKLVNESLSPYAREFSLSDLDIMSVNRDGSISSTTGYVEDKTAAYPPVRENDNTDETPAETAETQDPAETGSQTEGEVPTEGQTPTEGDPFVIINPEQGGGSTVSEPVGETTPSETGVETQSGPAETSAETPSETAEPAPESTVTEPAPTPETAPTPAPEPAPAEPAPVAEPDFAVVEQPPQE